MHIQLCGDSIMQELFALAVQPNKFNQFPECVSNWIFFSEIEKLC